jgi:hypothetical protein
MTRITLAAAITLAIAAQAARAERAPHSAAFALSNGQRHHYTIGGRVRPLLFWIGKDDVGDAIITERRDHDSAAYTLLIGSDPERAPRGINRWGYLAEEIRAGEATLVGLMTESNEESIDQADANLRKQAGDRTFNVIRASIAGGEARSTVTSVAAPSTYSFRQVDTVLALADRSGVDGTPRIVRLPAGSRPGFLTAVADLLHAQASDWRSSGRVRATEAVMFGYNGNAYRLRATRSRILGSERIGAKTYDHVIASQFVIESLSGGVPTEFSITYAADGPLAEIPISATYRPRWWIEIELTLDDTKPGPLPLVEVTR